MSGISGTLKSWKPGEDLGLKLRFAVGAVGRAMPGILSIMLRLGLILLFFWYLVAIVSVLSALHQVLAWIVGAAGLGMFLAFAWTAYRAFNSFDKTKDDVPNGIGPFLFLNLLPVLAVALAIWRNIPLGGGLLCLTAGVLKQLGSLVGL